MAERIFAAMQTLSTEMESSKEDYLKKFDQLPPPWTNLQKVTFSARVQKLQGDLDTWDEYMSKLEGKANVLKNDDDGKQQMFTRIDTVKQEHRSLINDIKMIILEGTGYLRVAIPEPVRILPPATVSPATLKIPSLNIQKFNGDYLKWKSFWQRFEINVHNHPFSNVEKLDALMGLLDGLALEEVSGFEIVGENYDTVVNTLVNRFGNPKIILKELYSNLRQIPTATSNAKSLRTTVNTIVNMCRQLQNYGADIDNNALQTEIIEKMPPWEQHELSWFQLETEYVTTEMILEKMKKIALKAEFSTQNNFSSTTAKTYSPNSKTTTNEDEYCNSSKRFACSLCKGDHWTANCPQFTTVEEKIKRLKLKNCCTNCARRNHDAKQCHANVVCQKCDGNHYAFICPTRLNTTFQKPNTSNTFVSTGAQQGSLLTKIITVINPYTNETADATVLFDPGSQRTYVSDNLIRQLKLPRGAKEWLNIQGIGAKATNYDSSLVKLRIKTTDDFEDIDANSIPKIANSVSVIAYEKNNPRKYTVTEATPDILIGMDYFFTFITSFEKQNEMVIVYSKVGQMLSGKIDSSTGNTTFSSLAIEKPKMLGQAKQQQSLKIRGFMQHRHPRTFYNSTLPKQLTRSQYAEHIKRLILKYSTTAKIGHCHGQSFPPTLSSQKEKVHETKTKIYTVFNTTSSGGGECLTDKSSEKWRSPTTKIQKCLNYETYSTKFKLNQMKRECHGQTLISQQIQSKPFLNNKMLP